MSRADSLAASLAAGFAWTVALTAIGCAGGLAGGLLLALGRMRLRGLPARLIDLGTAVVVGTPFVVQLMALYFGLPAWQALRHGPWWPLWSSPEAVAGGALALNSSAYTARILASAVTPAWRAGNQAAWVLGTGRWRAIVHVGVPGLWRLARPMWANEAVAVMHATSLTQAISVAELYDATTRFGATTFQPALAYTLGSLGFAALGWAIVGRMSSGRPATRRAG